MVLVGVCTKKNKDQMISYHLIVIVLFVDLKKETNLGL
jgi:hypothetical protein